MGLFYWGFPMRYIVLVVLLLLIGLTQAQEADVLVNYPACDFVLEEGLNFGAVVLDFETRLGCVENLNTSFNVASVPKVFIAAAYYNSYARGTISVATRIQFTRNYWMGGQTDCLTESRIGESFTYQELVEFMINCSDNAATWMLMDSLGWGRVNEYVQSLGIEGIGEIIPYSQVDRLKLIFLDERWADVPLAEASRFYRRGFTEGLSNYFTIIPNRPSREDFARINERYFNEYSYNTLTPLALATFFSRLREQAISGSPEEQFVASNIFFVMLYTQRLYSAQSFQGSILVGGKNGFDRGLLAEVNILFDDLDSRIPSGIVLLFSQYESLIGDNGALPTIERSRLNDYFFQLSPQVREILYPNYQVPPVERSFSLTAYFNEQSAIQVCWNPFFNSDFDSTLVPIVSSCFSSLTPRISYPADENLAMGLILNNLNYEDTRFVFIYTAPDSRQFSYQMDRRSVNNSAIYWFHPLDMAGQWKIDIYMNLRHVYSETILAQR
jgi:hypothetical protein